MAKKLALITGYAKDPAFVKTLLQALSRQTYQHFDCYIYASPSSLYYLEESFTSTLPFTCHHLQLTQNRGFAGNNNAAINAAFTNSAYDYAVLVNDDTIPQPTWLEELLNTAESNPAVGAVAPKMVFYQRFVTLNGIVSGTSVHHNRLLGIRFYLNSGFDGSFYPKRFYTNGFFAQEEDEINAFRWTGNTFTIELPHGESRQDQYTLRLFVAKNQSVKDQSVTISIGEFTTVITLQPDKIYYEITIPAAVISMHSHHIIQNAGGGITPRATYEIGFGEIDNGQYNTPRNVSLFCGGACLITRKALVTTGIFMEGLFSYYEDSDLSMRLLKKGFTIAYNPVAVIQHYHTGTSKEWSPFFTYYAFRNKIIFSAKTFGIGAFANAFLERFRETGTYFRLYARSRFRNADYKSRIKLNLVILKDALIGIVRFKPKFLAK